MLLSECSLDLTTIILELRQSVLYHRYSTTSCMHLQQHHEHDVANNTTRTVTATTTTPTTTSILTQQQQQQQFNSIQQQYDDVVSWKVIITDEQLFSQLCNVWKKYVFVKKDISEDVHLFCPLFNSMHSVDVIEFMKSFENFNVNILTSSILIDYHAFKIEEIQKGTCLNRLTKRMQLVFGPHMNAKYVSVFKHLYNKYITEPLNNYKIKADLKWAKEKYIQNNNISSNGRESKRGRKRKN